MMTRSGDAVERRPDHPGRGADALDRVAAAAAILDEHRFAAATDRRRSSLRACIRSCSRCSRIL